MGRRALLACLDEAQARSHDGLGSLPPSPPSTACAEREQAAEVPACGEDPAAQPPPAATHSLRANNASSSQGTGQAPAVSRAECAREAPARRADQGQPQCGSAPGPSQPESASEALAAPAAQGQPQRGRPPGPTQPDCENQAAGSLADLRLDSAPRRRLPTSRSLCYGEGPAVLDERCSGRDGVRGLGSAAADERCDGRASSPADERCGGRASGPAVQRCDGRVSSPTGKGVGCDGSSAGRASGKEPTQEPTQGAWRLEDAQALVVYGLGSLESGPAPRYQLALALLLAARMPALQPPIQVSAYEGVACI